MRVYRLVVVALVVLCGTTTAGHGQQPGPAESRREIDELVARLHQGQARAVAWSATARLQQLGAAAADALAVQLRSDPFRDHDHGNHSFTMEALAKIGPPAVAALDRLLTPALLESTDPVDRARAASAVYDETKRVAAEALARLGDPDHVAHVAGLMTSPSAYARQWSLAFAGRSRNMAFVPALIERLEDEAPTGRTQSRMVDGRLAGAPGRPPRTPPAADALGRAVGPQRMDGWRAGRGPQPSSRCCWRWSERAWTRRGRCSTRVSTPRSTP